ncbi:MAG: NifB/NifX family molybdenum-iron cluster-binding protein [Bacteroidota bacterium]|nr:NifB/NifX family molybdenum-iron cluster-binding protein [Bacteroidota bacterium]
MDMIKVVFATDDGKTYIDRHFGDAEHYDIYEVSSEETKFVKRISNTTEEEEGHADPKKAKGVAGLFKEDNVHVVVSKIFGPNIKRIKKNFVCVLMNDEVISNSIIKIQQNIIPLVEEWNKGGTRTHLNYKTLNK